VFFSAQDDAVERRHQKHHQARHPTQIERICKSHHRFFLELKQKIFQIDETPSVPSKIHYRTAELIEKEHRVVFGRRLHQDSEHNHADEQADCWEMKIIASDDVMKKCLILN